MDDNDVAHGIGGSEGMITILVEPDLRLRRWGRAFMNSMIEGWKVWSRRGKRKDAILVLLEQAAASARDFQPSGIVKHWLEGYGCVEVTIRCDAVGAWRAVRLQEL
ncbi:MAG: hypothetical protein ACKPKO_06925, partial [Candidatus Fonsibacter sp.]